MLKKFLLFVVLLLGPIMVVDATSISNIDMDIFVDMYGNANVLEIWDAYVSEGTEGWHPYYNLGESKISDLEVWMDGKKYTTISNWDINKSLNEKAYKAGIYHPSSDEVDISFGISNYGNHRYEIRYKISNFVATVDDADIIYWNLFPHNFSAAPDNVDITIYSDFRFKNTLDVWGYGKYGAPCYVYDGKIEMTSDNKRVLKDEYMTILVKFPKGTFKTSNILKNDFNYYLDMAEKGAINYNDKNKIFKKFRNIFSNKFNLFWLFIFLILISNRRVYLGDFKNKVKKSIPFFRDIPCNNDIFRSYWIANKYGLLEKKEDIFGAVILKWIYNGNIKLDSNKDGYYFSLIKVPLKVSEAEKQLYSYIVQASVNGILSKDDFENWCSSNSEKMLGWFDDAIYFETIKMLRNKEITYKKDSNMLAFNYRYFDVNSSIELESEQLAGLKKFLEDFTLIKERKAIEVKLWKNYLIYAQMFGIADKVSKQFKNFYPEITDKMITFMNDEAELTFIHSVVSSGINRASISKNKIDSYKNYSNYNNDNDYNSGGGGFSSGGGGGGASGGGGGGGGFR